MIGPEAACEGEITHFRHKYRMHDFCNLRVHDAWVRLRSRRMQDSHAPGRVDEEMRANFKW
jgi:hypothetical protein